MSTPHLTGTLPYQDACDMYHRHTACAHKLWATFGVVSLAALGYVAYIARHGGVAEVSCVVATSYAIFAICNLRVVRIAQAKCVAFARVLNRAARMQGAGNSPSSVESASVHNVTAAHVSATLVVLVSLAVTGLG
jgi:hypothetical protein